ncbi:MAG: glycosyltransferase [Proteobacteria bacterium]|nr:MAG: glycosyltransferase [Pseudomonadota bacterium]
MIVAYLLSALYIIGQLLPTALLLRFRRAGRGFESRYGTAPLSEEGISVLMPVKGPEANLAENIRALLGQDYQGKIELVLAFQEEKDADLAVADLIAAEYAGHPNRSVKILRGMATLGLNFKNSNLAQAASAATYDWLYCCDADTRVAPDHLRRAITLAQLHAYRGKTSFITSISVHENAGQPGAWLEAIGTNMEFANYFLLSHLSPKAGALNGASMFFHRETLDAIGGFRAYLNKITDDLAMQKAFVQAGALSILLPTLTRVSLRSQTFSGFYKRQLRWQLIVRCFDPITFYLLAPLNWAGQWLLFLAALSGSAKLATLGLAVLGVRLLRSFVFQIALGTPVRDWAKSICLPFYDFISPIIWLNTILVSQVQWAGAKLNVRRDGTLCAIRAVTNSYSEVTNASR